MPYKDPANQRAAHRRWKEAHPEKAHEVGHRAYKETAYAPNAGAEWTQAEDDLVLARTMTDRELGLKIKRSIGSIQVRRSRLKKWKEQDNG